MLAGDWSEFDQFLQTRGSACVVVALEFVDEACHGGAADMDHSPKALRASIIRILVAVFLIRNEDREVSALRRDWAEDCEVGWASRHR